MTETYSHTTWRVEPLESPATYVSLGPWASIDAVSSWRSLAGYHERVALLREVVVSFEPRTFELVAER